MEDQELEDRQTPGTLERKRSDAWKNFTDIVQSRAKCGLCSTVLSVNCGSTANLTRHLKRKHIGCVTRSTTLPLFRPPQPQPSTSATSSPAPVITETEPEPSQSTMDTRENSLQAKQPAIQSTIASYVKRPLPLSISNKLDEQLATMVVAEFHPLSLVENNEFKKFVRMLQPEYNVPSRKTLSNSLIPRLYCRTVEIVKEAVDQVSSVAITTDGWTSMNNEAYQAITVHFINKECELKSFLLGCHHLDKRHTAENLYEEISNSLQEWGLKEKVVAVVSDNAANITAAVRLGKWRHIPCFAHNLNLIVQKGLHEILDVHTKAKGVVEFFKRSTQATSKLKSLHTQMGYPMLKLKQDVTTRWNSTFDMFERIIKMKEPLLSALAVTSSDSSTLGLNQTDFDVMDRCCEILKPFRDVTAELSSEKGVAVSKLLLLKEMLLHHVSTIKQAEQEQLTSQIYKMCDIMEKEIERRFNLIEENPICSQATFLDPRFKRHGFSKELAYKNVYQKIIKQVSLMRASQDVAEEEDVNTQETEDTIWKDFDQKVSSIRNDCNPTASAIIEVDKFLQEPLLPRKSDPLKWWKERQLIYPYVFELMKTRLSIPATSVPCERIFSKSGQIITERRNRISPGKVNQILFLNHNIT